MTIRRLVQSIFALLTVMVIASAIVLVDRAFRRQQLMELQERSFRSFTLADELRESSDELTRFARTYVVTGDAQFEKYFRDVIAIRSGAAPLPEHYERVYWDFLIATGKAPRASGPPRSLRSRMEAAGFTQSELDLLARSQSSSDSLVAVEEEAFHAMKGEFADGRGGFTKKGPRDQALAIRLMFDSAYHRHKAHIMAPIDSFLAVTDARRSADLVSFAHQAAKADLLLAVVFGSFLMIVLLAYPVLHRRILAPVSRLQNQSRSLASDIDQLAAISTSIAGGDLSRSFAVGTTTLDVQRNDEIGELTRLQDSMVRQLQQTGTAIAAMTAGLRKGNEALGEHVTRLTAIEKVLRETARAAEVSTRAKSEFLAHMSHEIRTPMNAIIGYAQLLQGEQSLDAQQRRKVDAILTSGDHLLNLVNDVLEMSRIEAGRATMSMESFDLRELIETVRTMFDGQVRGRGLSLTVEFEEATPRLLESDAGKVRQVLVNLVSNAVKFTDSGGVMIRVTTAPAGDAGRAVTIRVADTGHGVAAGELAGIFDAFTQTAAGARQGGSGLGLAISRSFARLLGGDITVQSRVGEGSTFSFAFLARLTDAAAVPVAASAWLAKRLDPSAGLRTALIVDDVRSNREPLEEALTRAGMAVHLASSGEEALEASARIRPDVILMDVHMPGIGGLEAIRRLRAVGSGVPVIVMTAAADMETENAARSAGATAVVRKPYRIRDLVETIARALGVATTDFAPERAMPARAEPVALATVLRGIPSELATALRAACRAARATEVLAMATAIAPHSAAAAAAIRDIAHSFEYTRLIDALDEASKSA